MTGNAMREDGLQWHESGQPQVGRGGWPRTCAHRLARLCAAMVAITAALVWNPSHSASGSHETWDRLVRQYVDDHGRVAYRDLATRDRPALEEYLAGLAAADLTGEDADDVKAFWINAYNAGVVAAVLQGYTAENFIKRRFLFKGFKLDIAGETRTLDEIEHQILRQQFADPRTHFALVCASSSCPRLRRTAYLGPTIDTALDEEARRFINDPARNRIDTHKGVIALSAIFKWFADDFKAQAGSIEEFVARYVEGDAKRAFVRSKAGDRAYLDYDWTLNAQAGQRP